MNNVVEVKFGPRAPDDLPQVLREMADAAERGEITAFVGAGVRSDNYAFTFAASLDSQLVLATLLQQKIISNFHR